MHYYHPFESILTIIIRVVMNINCKITKKGKMRKDCVATVNFTIIGNINVKN